MADTATPTLVDDPAIVFGVPLGSALPTDEEVLSFVGRTVNLEKAHAAAVAADATALESRRAEIEAEVKASTKGIGAIGKSSGVVEQMIQNRLAEHHAATLAKSEQNRQTIVKQLHEASEKAQHLLRVFPSPVAMLSVYELGSEARTRYQLQLQNAGHAALQSLARYALASGNFALGAAIADRVAALPKEERPFSAHAIAEAFVGKRHAALSHAAKTIAAAFQRVINADREHTSGKRNSRDKIASGLRTLALNK